MGESADTKPKKKRGTRLKGTATQKPCAGCGEMKDRFADFKPRWAGCATHRTDRGRRYHEPGCLECEKIVNGNIRQPRCIECDKSRSKKSKDVQPTPVAAVVVEETPKQKIQTMLADVPADVPPEAVEIAQSALADLENGDAIQVEVVQPPEPVVVEAQEEPSPVSVPVPEPVVKRRPKIATMSDLSKLFDLGASSD